MTKLHLAFAAFMFPAILMFLITGALYTWGNKGDWRESTHLVSLETPYASQSQGDLTNIAIQTLLAQDIAIPSGTESLNGEGAGQSLNWTGARSEASVKPTDDQMVAEVALKEASVHRWLVQLHKAKGSVYFKVYATFLAVTLFLLVLSGVVMGLQVKSMRRLTLTSSVVGIAAFMGFVALG